MLDRDAHACSEEALLQSLASARGGLSEDEAARRLDAYGENLLKRAAGPSALRVLADQLHSVVVLLLVAAAATSFAMGEAIETAAIVAVLVINTAIGFVTEWRARLAMESLLKLDSPQAVVIREGRQRRIAARLIVPGDVVEITAGQHIPADGRVIEAANAQCDEAPLTGESMPVEKTRSTLARSTPLADRTNMVHKATTIIAGTARAVVTATGMATEVGAIDALVEGVRAEPTPLERRLDALGHRLVWVTLGVAAVVAALGVRQGLDIYSIAQTAIALAVAAVPEALPAVVTIALAAGMHRMARRNALVRRLPAVEALGSTTVVCTDKTRTLTSGDMRVVRLWAGDDYQVDHEDTVRAPAALAAIEAAVLASREQPDRGGDPVDRAMLECGRQFGIHPDTLKYRFPQVAELPFSSEHRLQASFRREQGALTAYVKGAPRHVIDRCGRTADGRILGAGDRARLHAANDRLAASGLRVIAIASGRVTAPGADALSGLTFLGLAGLIDPPAAGVTETIARLRAAGLRTVMLTGDQRLTARAIGEQLGLLHADAELVDGRDLIDMTPSALKERVARVSAYSRVTPADKLAIVQALQDRGDIVAMLGDGINDAAALKRADVGVSMGGRGTDVAKEAAAIILQDDRFETVAAAVEEGRIIFDNIRKFVFYLFSCNVAEIFVLLIAGLAAWPVPVLPLQLLWLNIVTDTFPALALAMEPGDPDVMRRPPRSPNEAFLSASFLWSIAFYATLITAATLAAFWWMHDADPVRARTVAFVTLGLAQSFHLVNARQSGAVTGRAHVSNPYAIAGVALAVALQLIAVLVPSLRAVLGTTALAADEWLVVAIASVSPALVGQAVKAIVATGRG